MRLLRILSVSFIAVLAMIIFLGCKQQPTAEKQQPMAFSDKDADWARVDLYKVDSPIQGFIDMKTYRPLDDLLVDFWHKLAMEESATITHLVLNCQEMKYQILSSLVYDENGELLTRMEEIPEWKNIIPDSNMEALCVTLAPTGEAVIFERDLPIIRELMLKGIGNRI